jgi:hypothetical protein
MNIFNDIILDSEYFIHPYECIHGDYDYKEIIEKAIGLTGGILELNNFFSKCNIEEFEYNLEVNNKSVNIFVQIFSNYVDSNGLISGLNIILEEIGYSGDKYFCDLIGDISEFGIAFITKEQEIELAKQGLISRKYF